ncbi:MAG: hypothetical protein ABIT07_01315 [Ferruginibacter sp.]
MPINKNHEFEDLDGIKCAIVEKNASRERVDFLKQILTYNHYTVVVVASPPPKAIPTATAPVAVSDPLSESEIGNAITELPPPPQTFTIGVTDVSFNPINAIFGRLLTTKTGHIITLAYWQQQENISHDDVPYFD